MQTLSFFDRLVVRSSHQALYAVEPESGEVLWDIPVPVGLTSVANVYRSLPDSRIVVAYNEDSEDIILLPLSNALTSVRLDDEDAFSSSANPDFVVTSQARTARELDRRMRRLEYAEARQRNKERAEVRAADTIERNEVNEVAETPLSEDNPAE